jgi:hypothetical protein
MHSGITTINGILELLRLSQGEIEVLTPICLNHPLQHFSFLFCQRRLPHIEDGGDGQLWLVFIFLGILIWGGGRLLSIRGCLGLHNYYN